MSDIRQDNQQEQKMSDERMIPVLAEYLRALRREAGRVIDPETAEVGTKVWREVLNPYGDDPVPPEFQCVGSTFFVRRPGSDVWIEVGDLPEDTWKKIEQRLPQLEARRVEALEMSVEQLEDLIQNNPDHPSTFVLRNELASRRKKAAVLTQLNKQEHPA
jgi:hypothetical protein